MAPVTITAEKIEEWKRLAETINSAVRAIQGKQLRVRFENDETAMYISAIVQNVGKAGKALPALLSEREALVEERDKLKKELVELKARQSAGYTQAESDSITEAMFGPGMGGGGKWRGRQ